MQCRAALTGLLVLLVSLPLMAGPAPPTPPSCSADAVKRDIQDTLLGGVDISTLRVTWSTDSEGPELDRYELWSRSHNGKGKRLGVIWPRRMCPDRELHEIVVRYDSALDYYIEIHLIDRTFTGVPVPVH